MQTKKVRTWKTKEGRELTMTEMTDAHLNNAIASYERGVIEPYLTRLEQLKNKLELLHAGDPRGVLGYDELIEERNRRKGA